MKELLGKFADIWVKYAGGDKDLIVAQWMQEMNPNAFAEGETIHERLVWFTNRLREQVESLESQPFHAKWMGTDEYEHVIARKVLDFIVSVGDKPTKTKRKNPLMRYSGTWTNGYWPDTVMHICWCWDGIIQGRE